MDEKGIMIPVERIKQLIVIIRGQKVMLDRDLAELYGVETKVLKQADCNSRMDILPSLSNPGQDSRGSFKR
jgi:hypothetical protein